MGSFLNFIIGIKFIIDTGWATIAGLGFAFNELGSNIVISISSAESVGTKVFNTSSLALWSSLYITLINY